MTDQPGYPEASTEAPEATARQYLPLHMTCGMVPLTEPITHEIQFQDFLFALFLLHPSDLTPPSLALILCFSKLA